MIGEERAGLTAPIWFPNLFGAGGPAPIRFGCIERALEISATILGGCCRPGTDDRAGRMCIYLPARRNMVLKPIAHLLHARSTLCIATMEV